jgi:hypothetical protein
MDFTGFTLARHCGNTPRATRRARTIVWGPLAIAVLTTFPMAVCAQVPDSTLWITNAQVGTVTQSGGLIYLGGSFTTVSPITGGGAALDTATAFPSSPYPRVNGTVFAAAPDGAGGWYIGGSFTTAVFALAGFGSKLLLGGSFTTMGALSQVGLASVTVVPGTHEIDAALAAVGAVGEHDSEHAVARADHRAGRS